VSDEPFRIQLTATAQRCLHRLPDKIVGACIEFIAGPLAVDPLSLHSQSRDKR
jgi:hypothetical protein